MAEPDTEGNSSIPEQLFHTVLTVVDYHQDTSGSTHDVHVLGTHTSLPAAKRFALRALEQLGYQPDDFEEYVTRADTPPEDWTHGDGVMVYAKAPRGQEFLVGLDTKPNTESLPAGEHDTLALPNGREHLHYVLQNRTDYNQVARSGAFQTCEIQGCYADRDQAVAAAKATLRDDREEYAQYDDRDDVESEGGWPFGDDVMVHAVAQTGENYTVAVKTPTTAREKHGKTK
ncbi:uncharacterized protein THITE_2118115 [Thermothielavioides terrestris NRRL 8126]|jgi:hypothetical protein|uniref:Uncharacterized protein n=1 Tax=Thermothielavioides terrestris (strain ATCC 38088 / NRRL 8126) TaxID=578455 RepID=G2R734_THETT|nr:uncharacterized protein THITE_2118115 [Thermothielavioides terrestris NRRL 8126]AEO68558.1 hypothetical protein THITE_2118115 [Thermothielavioides terrestris NRRL 8126]